MHLVHARRRAKLGRRPSAGPFRARKALDSQKPPEWVATLRKSGLLELEPVDDLVLVLAQPVPEFLVAEPSALCRCHHVERPKELLINIGSRDDLSDSERICCPELLLPLHEDGVGNFALGIALTRGFF